MVASFFIYTVNIQIWTKGSKKALHPSGHHPEEGFANCRKSEALVSDTDTTTHANNVHSLKASPADPQ